MEFEPIGAWSKILSLYLEAWIQIRIKAKGRIRIRIKAQDRIYIRIRIKVTSRIRIRNTVRFMYKIYEAKKNFSRTIQMEPDSVDLENIGSGSATCMSCEPRSKLVANEHYKFLHLVFVKITLPFCHMMSFLSLALRGEKKSRFLFWQIKFIIWKKWPWERGLMKTPPAVPVLIVSRTSRHSLTSLHSGQQWKSTFSHVTLRLWIL